MSTMSLGKISDGISADIHDLPEPAALSKRVGMVGDSITCHSHWWVFGRTKMLTALPGSDLDFRNLSIPGDSAVDAVERYSWDLQPQNLSVAIVMFGMNDVFRESYGQTSPGKENLRKRREAVAKHLQSIGVLVKKFQEDGVRVFLLSSTPYEQEAELAVENLHGVDDALAACAAGGKTLARKNGVPFLSVREPMLEINRRLRRNDRGATILGKDRVHPEVLGHAILSRIVFEKFLPDHGNSWIDLSGVASYRKTLPDVSENREALELLGVGGRKIVVAGKLGKGRWILCINDVPVFTAAAREWASGVDIAGMASPLRDLADRIHQAGIDLDREEKRHRNLLMFQGWSAREGSGREGEGFITYLETRKKEESPENWLALAAEDAAVLLGEWEVHREKIAFLRAELAKTIVPWKFRMEFIPANSS